MIAGFSGLLRCDPLERFRIQLSEFGRQQRVLALQLSDGAHQLFYLLPALAELPLQLVPCVCAG